MKAKPRAYYSIKALLTSGRAWLLKGNSYDALPPAAVNVSLTSQGPMLAPSCSGNGKIQPAWRHGCDPRNPSSNYLHNMTLTAEFKPSEGEGRRELFWFAFRFSIGRRSLLVLAHLV